MKYYPKMYMYTNYVITSYLNNACSCITQTGLHGNAWLVAMQSCLGHATILSSKVHAAFYYYGALMLFTVGE